MSIDTYVGMECQEIFRGRTPQEINFQPLGHMAFLVVFEANGIEQDPITLLAKALWCDESEQPGIMGIKLLMGASRFATVRRPAFSDHQLDQIITAEEVKASAGEPRRGIGRQRFQERNSSKPKFDFFEPDFRFDHQPDLVPVLYQERGRLICGFEYGGVCGNDKNLGAIFNLYSYNPAKIYNVRHTRNLIEVREEWILRNRAKSTPQPVAS